MIDTYTERIFSLFWKDKNKSYVSVEENQRIFIQDMLNSGYYATWAAGFENAQREINNYMRGLV
jgi:hypothetical protein